MKNSSFPIRMKVARVMRHLSMEQLSLLTNKTITKQSISRYEKGLMKPKPDTLRSLSLALDISADYFEGEGIHLDVPMLRMALHSAMTLEDAQLEAQICYWAEHYLVQEQKLDWASTFHNPLGGTIIHTKEDAEEAALELRRQWNIGDGPIASVYRLLERKGIKLFETDLPKGLLGMCTWANQVHPLIILTNRQDDITPERLRFTAAHELGHLLLSISEDEDKERRCDQFAACFLFPNSTFIEEIGSHRDVLTLPELIDLHLVYGVSIAAMIHRAKDLKIISEEHYNWWYNEVIHENPAEIGWGVYPVPETLGREKRIESIIETINKQK